MKYLLSIFKLQLRPMPKSVWRNTFPPEVQHNDVFPERELVDGQTMSINPLNLFAKKKLDEMYKKELPPKAK